VSEGAKSGQKPDGRRIVIRGSPVRHLPLVPLVDVTRFVIREVATNPALPPDLVVYRRDDIREFVESARRAFADLQAELADARAKIEAAAASPAADDAIDLTEDGWLPYKRNLFSLPDWTDPVERPRQDNVAFFESLREPDAPLIAGARATEDASAQPEAPAKRWVYRRTVGIHPAGTRRFG
jgi:hypothetical protein